MPDKLYLPTEEEEQTTFVQWLGVKKLKFTAIPNSTYTLSWNQKRKNKATGVRKGLPDLLIIIPENTRSSNGGLIFIEMKRRKGGVVSPEQKEWIAALNGVMNVEAWVCRGADEAIKTMEKHIYP